MFGFLLLARANSSSACLISSGVIIALSLVSSNDIWYRKTFLENTEPTFLVKQKNQKIINIRVNATAM
jgi:hypothetical protein